MERVSFFLSLGGSFFSIFADVFEHGSLCSLFNETYFDLVRSLLMRVFFLGREVLIVVLKGRGGGGKNTGGFFLC